MTVSGVILTVLLCAAAGLTLYRILRGPAVLDRVIATDVLLAVVVAAIAAEAAFSRDATALPVLVVLSILGFVGSVGVARLGSSTAEPDTAASAAAGQSDTDPAALNVPTHGGRS
ncbi:MULTISPECIES: monovalent cation/H+ antiporter complex subunit F [Catenuloplanes]|uniref:Multicomponent Na+:H+ antiporter subunit F n=1 Tax=Catenuloplanes niger TaxID=587534 RepID=A0AAE4A025_9ACTN|nr:multicomponent Na+:H+ antiporter subunit F [Catenuloplanes niger]